MNRRQFLGSGITALAAYASHPANAFISNVNSAIVSTGKRVNDYKCLVCVNLQGGADSVSLFVPTNNAEYNQYLKIRQNLSYQQSSINPLVTNNENLDGIGFPDFINSFKYVENLISIRFGPHVDI